MHEHPNIAVLYHGGCPDGLGGAYAAWKKFGDTAEYIPVKHGYPVPEGLEGREMYLIDFSFPQEEMDTLLSKAGSLVVLEHHLGTKTIVESMPQYVFDEKRSGATIAWSYFHPETPVPKLLQYIEDGDLYKFELPSSREILAYIYNTPLLNSAFEHWDTFARNLEDPAELQKMADIGKYFRESHTNVVENAVRHAELVEFEGHTCLLTGSSGEFVSDVGNRLAVNRPPFGIVVVAGAEGVKVSLRSDKSIDVAEIARRFGGNGHPAAAGFRVPYGEPVPWKLVHEQPDENPRD